ncbi:DUF1657 domain-containing protein [Alkaliphilus pronyensis]|uniref:DUF1657 domain-containing protein n=1 Tax=Alkaliphilus pronyensis TaxID=1482732 RepID=A0A6I0F8X9_9FIRM|nr:DUF1657 domain-containing protein [Alkaliphilus pronyensis]KAB3532777.1 DUF1657 domain-containing protein [Alkaliphilus pronyensis]
MTVATQVKQTYGNLKGALATIQTYQLHHPNPETKRLMEECNTDLQAIIDALSIRIKEIEQEEQQFKGF